MNSIAKDKNPQTLLNRGNVFFAKYHVTGNDNTISSILKSKLNKISIAQIKKGK